MSLLLLNDDVLELVEGLPICVDVELVVVVALADELAIVVDGDWNPVVGAVAVGTVPTGGGLAAGVVVVVVVVVVVRAIVVVVVGAIVVVVVVVVVVVDGNGGVEHNVLDEGGVDVRTAALHPLGEPMMVRGNAHVGCGAPPTLGSLSVNAIDRH